MYTLLNHQLIAFRRSRSQGGNIAARGIMFLFVLYFVALAIGAGFNMEQLIQSIFPGMNAIVVFNGFILYYFLADFLLRTQLQELPILSIVPYLHLNISRIRIINYQNLTGLVSAFNIIPLFLFLPFIASNIVNSYSDFTGSMFAIAILSLVVFINYLALYLKRKWASNFIYLLVSLAVVIALVALDHFKIISTSVISSFVFGEILNQPLLALGFTFIAGTMFFINVRYLRKNLYVENLSKKEESKTSTDYAFLNRFGKVGELTALELKLILRHKRSRTSLYGGFIFLAYGFMFYKEPFLENNQFGSMLFAAIFVTGISLVIYGQFMFAWQSAHFDGLLANKIDLGDFIKAKFLLLTISCTVITLIATFYGFISWKLLLLHLAAYLYNIGFGIVIVLWFATKNYKRLDLSSGSSFNWQGTGAVQWIMGIPLIVIPFLIYLPFQLAGQSFLGLYALSFFGIISLLMRNFWIKHLTRIVLKQRYKIAEGFRE